MPLGASAPSGQRSMLFPSPTPDTVECGSPTSVARRTATCPRGGGTAMLLERATQHKALLERCILFSVLDDSDRAELADRATELSYDAGTPIFHLGDPGESMMVVLSGCVRISLPTRQGKDLILTDLSKGEVFGEVALLDGQPRSAGALALTNCDLLVLRRRDVYLPAVTCRSVPGARRTPLPEAEARRRKDDGYWSQPFAGQVGKDAAEPDGCRWAGITQAL